MKIIILAAGKGSRLRPLTNEKPKCMVEYKSKPMIDYILDTVKECNIKDIAVINGYKRDVLEEYLKNEKITFFTNETFDKTNMVSTLFNAKEFMNDDMIISEYDIIISYSDIIYKKEILDKLIESKDDFSVVVDKKWRELWSLRMENPLDDAETLKIENGNIVELGRKPNSYDEIEGQYIGLIKISKNIVNRVIEFYDNLDKDKLYDGADFDNMYMTSFIQMIINDLVDVKPIFIEGGWLEIDSVDDLNRYEQCEII